MTRPSLLLDDLASPYAAKFRGFAAWPADSIVSESMSFAAEAPFASAESAISGVEESCTAFFFGVLTTFCQLGRPTVQPSTTATPITTAVRMLVPHSRTGGSLETLGPVMAITEVSGV